MGEAGSGRRGAGTVAVGVLLAGVATYVFLVLVARGLGTVAYAPFAVGWSVSLVLASGLFSPLEQETARRVALARAAGRPAAPELLTTATVSGAVALVGVVALLTVAPVASPLLERGGPLWWALMAVTAAYAAQMPARGALSGGRRFGAYGAVLGVEGVSRAVLAGALLLLGSRSPGLYLLLVAAGACASLAPALWVGARAWSRDGARVGARAGAGARSGGRPRVRVAEVRAATVAVGVLVLGTLAAQVLLNVGPVLVTRLAAPGEEDAASRLLAGMSLVRVPLFMFTAVQATLIPRLTAHTAHGDADGFRRALVQLLTVIAAVTAAAAGASLLVGEPVVRLLYGAGFELPGTDLALLAAGVGAYLVALSMSTALVALDRHVAVLRGWVAGLVVLAVVTWLVDGLLLRIELGFAVGALGSALWLLLETARARAAGRRGPTG